ncbi:MAG: hypothetical protein AAB336_00185 [Acidobacteriota bacterium]
MSKIILIVNLASTLYLTGVIWLIQLVQYPFFAQVGRENFQEYHASHTFWITPVVAPAMILELITSVFLILYPPENIDGKLIWLALFLTLTVWLSTFFLQVPMHEKLAQGFDAEAHRFLVNSNWIRTIAWTLRSGLVCYFLWKLVRF